MIESFGTGKDSSTCAFVNTTSADYIYLQLMKANNTQMWQELDAYLRSSSFSHFELSKVYLMENHLILQKI